MDFLHLDRAKNGFEFALIVTDHFTRFTQIYGTKKNSALAAADKIFKVAGREMHMLFRNEILRYFPILWWFEFWLPVSQGLEVFFDNKQNFMHPLFSVLLSLK